MTSKKMMPWYQFSEEELNKHLHTDFTKGLDAEEVERRQKKFGKNVFSKEEKETLVERIFRELKNPLVSILLFAGIATFFLKEYVDMVVIFLALTINIVVGIVQEGRASKAFEKLSSSQERFATVKRSGGQKVVSTEDLVPGDIIKLSAGAYIPADARLLSEKDLTVNEASLTGEWVDVSKEVVVISKESSITNQTNMVWMGTLVSGGTAEAVVVATGDHTQIGTIAQSLARAEETMTPLQKNIQKLGHFLLLVVLIVLVAIFILGILRGNDIFDMALMAVAIAVAALPQGLPVAVTVVLVIGMESILKKNGLVKNLLAAETLGSTTIILTDKTGTLTRAEMRVASIVTLASVEKGHGESSGPGKKIHAYDDDIDVLKMAILTSDAFVEGKNEALSEWIVRGRPVERAITLAGLASNITQTNLLKTYPQVDFLPFETERRFAASLNKKGRLGYRICVTGAPEFLLDESTHVYLNGKKEKLSEENRTLLRNTQEHQSSEGMRLVAVAFRDTTKSTFETQTIKHIVGKNLVFAGFIVLHDPLRTDVRESIQIAKDAGTRIIMATGDHKTTALKIAQEAGIAGEPKEGQVLTGEEVESLDDQTLLERITKAEVFARVLPEQKLRIAQLLKSKGEVVAMTGDGINDAPALRSADIGIALGSGTEVAKEASDLILLDNSFSIIVRAIEEGRRIMDNLKKIVAYLLSTSFSEIFIVSFALLLGGPLPILPTQILWIKIIEEGFMNFAFAFEPKENDLMKRDPRDSATKNILTKNLKKLIIIIASVTGVLLIGMYSIMLYFKMPAQVIHTVMFAALSVDSIFFALSIKNLHLPLWKINVFTNKYLIYALTGSFAMLIISLEWRPLQKLLQLEDMGMKIFFITIAIGIINLAIIELAKYFVFEKKNDSQK